MLKNKTYEDWWEYWLSKIPPNHLPAGCSTAKPLKLNAEPGTYRARLLQRLRVKPVQNVNPDIQHTGAERWED